MYTWRIIIFTDAHILTTSAHQDLTAFNRGLIRAMRLVCMFVWLPFFALTYNYICIAKSPSLMQNYFCRYFFQVKTAKRLLTWTNFILMDLSKVLGEVHLAFKGPQVEFSKLRCIYVPCSILAYSSDINITLRGISSGFSL